MIRLCLFIAALCLAFVQEVFAQDANAPGVSARSEHFTLISDRPVDAAALLSDLERFRRVVVLELELGASNQTVRSERLSLSIIEDPSVFTAITPSGLVGAVYLQSAAGNDIVVTHDSALSQDQSMGALRLLLRHELVHHLLETRYPRKLPVWLDEGLAEYYATYRPDAQGQPRFDTALLGQDPLDATQRWLPMRTVIENLSTYPDFRAVAQTPPSRAQRLYYGQSWALAQFVMDQPDGLARVHAFVDGWLPAKDSEDSFEAAFGLRYGPLETWMRDKAARRMNKPSHSAAPVPAPDITVHPASQTQILQNRLRLLLAHGHAGYDLDDRIDALAVQLGEAARTDALTLARSLRFWRQGDWDGSDAATDSVLEAALKAAPDQPSPLKIKALKIKAKTAYGRVSERQSDQSLWDAAEAAALQGLAVSPQDAELHLFRVAVGLPTSEQLSPGAMASLDWLENEQVHQRLPHTAMMMIPALLYDDRFDEADAVLDSAERWVEQPSDRWVIDRLRGNVATERIIAQLP